MNNWKQISKRNKPVTMLSIFKYFDNQQVWNFHGSKKKRKEKEKSKKKKTWWKLKKNMGREEINLTFLFNTSSK